MSKTALKIYFNWLLVNVFLCLLPLTVSLLIINQISEGIISSLIAYCFTLLITSLYIFDRDSELESTLKWFGISFFSVLWALYIYYPTLVADSHKSWINENLKYLIPSILLTTLIISFCMNLPSIKSVIERKKGAKEFEIAKKTGSKVDEMIRKISKDK